MGAKPAADRLPRLQVRSRAEEVRRSLDQIIQGLQFAADRVQWSDTLDRYAVINVQYQHLLDALRPLLRQFAAYPRSVNQSNAPILPIMLATRLLLEMEEEEQALLEPPAQLSLAEQFAGVQDQEHRLNHTIDHLTREEEAPLGDTRRRRAQQAAANMGAGARLRVGAMLPAGGQQPHLALQRAEQADPLLAAVTFGAGLS